jgi:hypothetical protein
MKNVQDILDKHYDSMFHELCQLDDDNLYEFKIVVKLKNDGTTISRSWLDREKMLEENNEEM